MREIHVDLVADTITRLFIEACTKLEPDIVDAITKAQKAEQSPVAKAIFGQIVENYTIAQTEVVPMCQDTGSSLVFLEIGQDVHFTGGYLYDAINRGVAKAYIDGYLRKSILDDPIRRVNTKDNTPAFIYTDIVPGDKLRIRVDAKGGGSENMAQLKMLPPSAGWEGAKKFIVESVAAAGPNACPPLVVGVGIGGNFDKVALLAKKSLLRHVGAPNPDPEWAAREQEVLTECNKLGVGAMGLGGTTTAFAVHIETMPVHLTGLPVAINLDCHAHRHKEVVL